MPDLPITTQLDPALPSATVVSQDVDAEGAYFYLAIYAPGADPASATPVDPKFFFRPPLADQATILVAANSAVLARWQELAAHAAIQAAADQFVGKTFVASDNPELHGLPLLYVPAVPDQEGQ